MELILWGRHIFYALIVMGMVVSISSSIVIISDKVLDRINPCIYLWICKTSVLLALLPILTPFLYLRNMSYQDSVWLYKGNVLGGVSYSMMPVYSMIFLAYCTGFIISFVKNHVTKTNLGSTLKGTVPLDNHEWLDMLEEYKEKYSIRNVEFLQNDLLFSPITVGVRNYKIIIPYRKYQDKHIHMILEHEFYHIRHKDIIWKKLCLAATYIHWCNILVKDLFNRLVFQHEAVCDLYAANNNEHYTWIEYVRFLAELDDNDFNNNSSVSVCEKKSFIVRRIEYLMKYKVLEKPKMKIAVLCIAALIAVSLAPSYAVAAQISNLEDIVIEDTAVKIEEPNVPHVNYLQEYSGDYNDGFNEKWVSDPNIMMLGSTCNINITVAPGDRLIYSPISVQHKQKITVSVAPDSDDVTYRVGIRCDLDKCMIYVEGTGVITHTFTVPHTDKWSIYVQNMDNNNRIHLDGFGSW